MADLNLSPSFACELARLIRAHGIDTVKQAIDDIFDEVIAPEMNRDFMRLICPVSDEPEPSRNSTPEPELDLMNAGELLECADTLQVLRAYCLERRYAIRHRAAEVIHQGAKIIGKMYVNAGGQTLGGRMPAQDLAAIKAAIVGES